VPARWRRGGRDDRGRPGGPDLRQDLPFGHKVALRALQAGEPVRKYGQAIGVADKAIAVGDHVHVHNLIGSRSGLRGAQHG